MKKIRFHGRGGQGVVIGAEMLAYALVLEGKYASSLPSFGVERRGAPVTASVRLSDQPIRDTHLISDPDCIVIIDPIMAKMPGLLEGLSGDGMVIANSHADLQFNHANVKVIGLVDATGIALQELGRAASNTCMLGAIARATGWVGLDAVVSSLDLHFSGNLMEKNANAVRRGYEGVKVNLLKA